MVVENVAIQLFHFSLKYLIENIKIFDISNFIIQLGIIQ
jgi:hypothetical protein